jgi:anti-sigma factor RsiW
MCDFSGKLMPWLDHELPADDAADVARHLQLCLECRGRVEAYRQLSGAFDGYCDAYCDETMALRPRRKLSRRTLTVAGAAALAAAMAALVLLAPRARIRLSPVLAPAPVANAAIVSQPPAPPVQAAQAAQAAAVPIKTIPRLEQSKGAEQIRHPAPQPQAQATNWLPPEPAVEIAIPADAIFPPGAVPEGVSFTAEVAIAPDGSAQQIRLRPQLTEFERRSTRP